MDVVRLTRNVGLSTPAGCFALPHRPSETFNRGTLGAAGQGHGRHGEDVPARTVAMARNVLE
jgi:hypothetical protein